MQSCKSSKTSTIRAGYVCLDGKEYFYDEKTKYIYAFPNPGKPLAKYDVEGDKIMWFK